MSRDTFRVKAFYLDVSATPEGGQDLVYKPAEDDDRILNTPPESLIFAPERAMDQDELRLLFEERFPTTVASTTRVRVITTWGYGRGYKLDRVEICPTYRQWYPGSDAEVACRLAKEHGTVFVEIHWQREELEQYGCYSRPGDISQLTEIVYNPNRVAGNQKRREKLKGRQTCRYLMVYEFNAVSNAISSKLEPFMPLAPWVSFDWTRRETIRQEVRYITLFNSVFGKNAHRKLDAFQDFLKLWRQHHEKTKAAFLNSPIDWLVCQSFFDWLDEEAKQPRPRNKKLRVLRSAISLPLSPFDTSEIPVRDLERISDHVKRWIRVTTRRTGKLETVVGTLHSLHQARMSLQVPKEQDEEQFRREDIWFNTILKVEAYYLGRESRPKPGNNHTSVIYQKREEDDEKD